MPRHDLLLPDLGMDNQPIAVSVWLVEVGNYVRAGDPVVEILAGPATVDLPAPVDGVLAEILAEEDEPVVPGQRLAVIEDGDDRYAEA